MCGTSHIAKKGKGTSMLSRVVSSGAWSTLRSRRGKPNGHRVLNMLMTNSPFDPESDEVDLTAKAGERLWRTASGPLARQLLS